MNGRLCACGNVINRPNRLARLCTECVEIRAAESKRRADARWKAKSAGRTCESDGCRNPLPAGASRFRRFCLTCTRDRQARGAARRPGRLASQDDAALVALADAMTPTPPPPTPKPDRCIPVHDGRGNLIGWSVWDGRDAPVDVDLPRSDRNPMLDSQLPPAKRAARVAD